jgi:hypothetical protein
MKKLIILGLVIMTSTLRGQDLPPSSKKFIEENLIEIENKESSLIKRETDFSEIWMHDQENIIGFIGDDFDRFFIHFDTIIQNRDNKGQYFVRGKTKVKNKENNFMGKFNILSIRDMKDKIHTEGDNRTKGIVLLHVFLHENLREGGMTTIVGVLKSYLYVENGKVKFDDLEFNVRERYNNNQFVGNWHNHETNVAKSCHWGMYRIPYCGDLDVGSAKFSPNEKYFNNGWENYYRAFILNDSRALKKEVEIWKNL